MVLTARLYRPGRKLVGVLRGIIDFSKVCYMWIVLKKSAMKPWIHSHRSVLIKVDATSSP